MDRYGFLHVDRHPRKGEKEVLISDELAKLDQAYLNICKIPRGVFALSGGPANFENRLE